MAEGVLRIAFASMPGSGVTHADAYPVSSLVAVAMRAEPVTAAFTWSADPWSKGSSDARSAAKAGPADPATPHEVVPACSVSGWPSHR